MKKNEVKVLSEKEHVLRRAGMYIGSTEKEEEERWVYSGENRYKKEKVSVVPGFLKLVDEVVSNSIDEYYRMGKPSGYRIGIDIEGGNIRVIDSGRGMPLEMSPDIEGKTMAEVAATSLRSGTNFEEDNISIGTNGLGLSLVNLFSKKFELEAIVDRKTLKGKKNRIVMKCRNNMEEGRTEVSMGVSKKSTMTSIRFLPDYELFGMEGIDETHLMIIRKRINDLSMIYPEIGWYISGKSVGNRVRKSMLEKFNNYCLVVAGGEENGKKWEGISSIVGDVYKVGVLPGETFEHISFVNGIDTSRGGGHVTYCSNYISNMLCEKINKRYKIKLNKNDIRNKITLVVSVTDVKGLTFDSQTKERVTNSSKFFQEYVPEKELDKLIKIVIGDESIVMPIIEASVIKQKMKEAADIRVHNKKSRRKRVIKHVEAKGPGNTLFLTEGDSAIANLLKVRNPKTQGGFPLKGKLLNTIDLKPANIIKNEEITSILSILGLKVGEEAKKLNYEYIGILGDADHDGYHIVTLLIGLFSHWPELFKERRIRYYKSPLMIATKGKKRKILYSLNEVKEFDSRGWKTKYIKGLGAMNEDIYEEVINQEPDILIWDDNTMQSVKIALGHDYVDARKKWLSL
jgi:DNA gyrase/topoisomerase IV subunit B